jgi:hypothetical protein
MENDFSLNGRRDMISEYKQYVYSYVDVNPDILPSRLIIQPRSFEHERMPAFMKFGTVNLTSTIRSSVHLLREKMITKQNSSHDSSLLFILPRRYCAELDHGAQLLLTLEPCVTI